MSWYDQPRTAWDVARCVLGLHRPALSGRSGGLFVQRCSCGAFGPSPWMFLTRSERRGKWSRRS